MILRQNNNPHENTETKDAYTSVQCIFLRHPRPLKKIISDQFIIHMCHFDQIVDFIYQSMGTEPE